MKDMKALEECVLNNLVKEGVNKINKKLEDIKNLSVDFKWDSQNLKKINEKYEKMRQGQDKGYRKVLALEERILKSAEMIPFMFPYRPPETFFEKMAEIKSKREILEKFVNA